MSKTPSLRKAYRLVSPKWSDTALSGEGARLYGGRWNSPGRSLVYLGSTRALTALELLVHLTTTQSRAKSYHLIEISIPADQVSVYPPSILPKGWRDFPAKRPTQEIGDDWLLAGNQLALEVPSVIIPEETNLLLNPAHPDFKKVTQSSIRLFHFDPRL